MLPGNLAAVEAILLAIVPGFLATMVWARARTWRGPSGDLRTVLESLALSLVIQVAVAPLTIEWLYPVRDVLVDYPERVAVWLALVVLVMPVAGGLLAARVNKWVTKSTAGRIRRILARAWPASPPPSTWDWLFTNEPPNGKFLVIDFQDGRKIAGVFARGSVALTSPEPHGLFLASEWRLNDKGDIIGEVPGTNGVLIQDADSIQRIRILEGGHDEGE